MSDKITVSENGILVTLPSGATVAGFTSDQGGFAWLFTNCGVKTPLGLSKEAMDAVINIHQLLVSGAAREQSPPVQSRWVLVRETPDETNGAKP